MTEGIKTVIYCGVAVVAGLLAFFSQPGRQSESAAQRVVMFPDFDNPEAAARLEIVKSASIGDVESFEVAKDPDTGAWSLPPQNYPADAEDQMKEVSTLLVGLKIEAIQTDNKEEHEMYGVVDPSNQDTDQLAKGLGTMVRVKDSDGKTLADIVIGKSASEGSSKGEDFRFVRRPSEDRVYVVKINTEKLSTKFQDWIKQDLLDLNALDVENMSLFDYGIVREGVGATLQKRAEMDVAWNSDGGKWELKALRGFKNRKTINISPTPNEELDQTKLDDMKRALDDLKIAGVQLKPDFLNADLKVSGKVQSSQAQADLQARGFYADQDGNVLGANGEVHVVMKDGVEYVLHFGRVSGLETKEKKDQKDGESNTSLNRFLMVRCQINMSKFPMPVKEKLKLPKSNKSDQPPAPGSKGKKKKDDGKKKKKDVNIELEAEKTRIEKEYKKKLEDRQKKIADAKKRVKELNNRFAKWYYIVAEDVYKKIHLSREVVLKESSKAKEEGFGIDAFRALEKGGIKGSSSDSTTPPGGPGGPGVPGGPGAPGGPGVPGGPSFGPAGPGR